MTIMRHESETVCLAQNPSCCKKQKKQTGGTISEQISIEMGTRSRDPSQRSVLLKRGADRWQTLNGARTTRIMNKTAEALSNRSSPPGNS
uniref:Uncharacterized protein n=1 Tax=Anopheles albimanus TaxID=7167 RepID=A0A182FXX1_ANOAL